MEKRANFVIGGTGLTPSCFRRGTGGDRDPRRWGKKKTITMGYLSLHCHHQNEFCIKMGSDGSRFNVSLTVMGKVTRQCPQVTRSEEKGEPKRNRSEVLLFSSLTPYSKLSQTGSLILATLLVECCFTSIETVGLLGTGAQDVHLNFHTAPELCSV